MREFDLARATAITVLEHAAAHDWSVQGFGMMRIYFGDDRRFRLNVWDPSLAIPRVSLIHDHPWDFKSWILGGYFENQRFIEDGYGRIYNWMYLEPGEQGGPRSERQVTKLREAAVERYFPGDTYEQRVDEIHASYYGEGAVTLNDRTGRRNDDRARVFWRDPWDWVDAKPRPATPEEIERVSRGALRLLHV